MEPIPNGLAFICKAKGDNGTIDVESMAGAFTNLPYAVLVLDDIRTAEELIALFQAAARYSYSGTVIQAIVFYFAGSATSDSDSQVFIMGEANLHGHLVAPFYPENSTGPPANTTLKWINIMKKDIKRLFFFDIRLRPMQNAPKLAQADLAVNNTRFLCIARKNCLVAYSAQVSDTKPQGYWTNHLHRNIGLDTTIMNVLDKTWKETVSDRNAEVHGSEPQVISCMGPFNLSRPLQDAIDLA